MDSQQNTQETIDILQLIKHCLHNWYWFALSIVVCVGIGLTYFFCTTKKYAVNTSLLLRDDSSKGSMLSNLAGDMGSLLSLSGMGSIGKSVDEEIEILSSKTLYGNVIRSLQLQTEYRKKQGLRWVGEYPIPDIMVSIDPLVLDTISGEIKLTISHHKNGYKVKYSYLKDKQTYNLSSIYGEITTNEVGIIKFFPNVDIAEGAKYKITTSSLPLAIENFKKEISVSRKDKKTNIISISSQTDMPDRAIDFMNKQTDFYNMDGLIDKNHRATEQIKFLDERLKLITAELDSVENMVEEYKTDNQISGLSAEAEMYLRATAEYRKQLVEIETQLSLIDYIQQFVSNEDNKYSPIPANLGVSDPSLTNVIGQYNELLLNRMKISRTATDKNPMLENIDEQLVAMRQNIMLSISSVRDGLKIMRTDAQKQERQYSARIENVPQQEHEYIQIKRMQAIKQSVFMFIYQKREEQALTLASNITPAKIIDAPMRSPKKVAPRGSLICLIALIIGGIIPLGIIIVLEMYMPDILTRKDRKKEQTLD